MNLSEVLSIPFEHFVKDGKDIYLYVFNEQYNYSIQVKPYTYLNYINYIYTIKYKNISITSYFNNKLCLEKIKTQVNKDISSIKKRSFYLKK